VALPLEQLPAPPGSTDDGPVLFDRVLVDAPCSGLGTLRRNPDARWRVRPEDVGSLADLQKANHGRAASQVRPGGSLAYSTCTMLHEENEDLVRTFLQENPDFRLVPKAELPEHLAALIDEEGFMRCWPHHHDMDGFFAARFERSS
jgi:16S rRNA (cytosine967-C5)-methyltransferase